MCACFNGFRRSGCPQHSLNLRLSFFVSVTNTHTDRRAYTVLVAHQVQQKVHKHGFSPAIRLERMAAEKKRTSIYRGEWQKQPQMDQHKPATKRNTFSAASVCAASAVFHLAGCDVKRDVKKRRFHLACANVLDYRGHLLSQDFLPVMKPEIWRGSWPSVATAISSWPRDNQNSSRLFRSVSTSAKSGSCTDWNSLISKWINLKPYSFVNKCLFNTRNENVILCH